MDYRLKSFEELTLTELYQLLRLRIEVFVVEQDCVYQDIDNKDQQAWHLTASEHEMILGYTRIFGPNVYFEQSAIGRVVVARHARGKGVARRLMEESIAFAKANKWPTVKISAQTYLIKFYGSLGFEQVGEGYLEDGIPHVAMVMDLERS